MYIYLSLSQSSEDKSKQQWVRTNVTLLCGRVWLVNFLYSWLTLRDVDFAFELHNTDLFVLLTLVNLCTWKTFFLLCRKQVICNSQGQLFRTRCAIDFTFVIGELLLCHWIDNDSASVNSVFPWYCAFVCLWNILQPLTSKTWLDYGQNSKKLAELQTLILKVTQTTIYTTRK